MNNRELLLRHRLRLITAPLAATAITLVYASGLFSQSVPPTQGRNFTYSGLVVAAGDGRPVENAEVVLFGCNGPPTTGNYRIASTDAEGRFRFANTPWARVGVRVTHAGFVPALWQLLCANPGSAEPASIEMKLKSAATPVQMKDGLAFGAYANDQRPHVRFRSGTLNADSSALRFITEDCYTGGCLDKGWRYDLRTQRLEPGPVPAFNSDKTSWSYDPSKPPNPTQLTDSGPPDWRTIGAYQVQFDVNISYGCDNKILGRMARSKEFLITNHSCAWLPSPDGTAIFWADPSNPNDVDSVWAFNFTARKKVHVSIPTAMGDFLAVGRIRGGFLVAYEVAGSCLGANSDFLPQVERIAGDLPQPIFHVCFLEIRAPLNE
jgi:hypothetical protein